MAEEEKDYWLERAERKQNEFYGMTDEREKELHELYRASLDSMQKEISYFYLKYARDNEVTYAEAVRMLTADENRVFKRDIIDYLEEIERLGDTEEARELHKELNAVAMNAQINRLEALSAQVSAIVGIKTIKEAAIVTDHLSTLYKEAYYKTIYDVGQFTSISGNFTRLNKRLIETAVTYPWSGEDFSSRIWSNKDKLVKVLRQELTKGLIQGNAMQKVSSEVARQMDVSVKQAAVVVQTESAAVIETATMKAYEETKVVVKYEFLATLDKRTSKKCQRMDGYIGVLEEAVQGVNLPPLHPRCRSTTVPRLREPDKHKKRLAKDATGKTIEVPRTMKYEEFKATYLTK